MRRGIILPKKNIKRLLWIRKSNISYKIYGGTSEHITFTIGASAAGEFLPSMITFKTLPKSTSFHGEGPTSGHTDSQLYLSYIKHIEPFLNLQRPVIIFQDNLGAHENLELIQFC